MVAQPPRRRPARRRGFTLLEMLVTLVITTVGLTGLLSLHVVLTKGNELSARSGEAVAIAQRTLEEYRNRKALALLTEFSVVDLPIDATLDTVAGRAGTTFARRLIVQQLTTASNSLIRLRVVVSWTDDGATAGAQGGILDHQVALEINRTVEEDL